MLSALTPENFGAKETNPAPGWSPDKADPPPRGAQHDKQPRGESLWSVKGRRVISLALNLLLNVGPVVMVNRPWLRWQAVDLLEEIQLRGSHEEQEARNRCSSYQGVHILNPKYVEKILFSIDSDFRSSCSPGTVRSHYPQLKCFLHILE